MTKTRKLLLALPMLIVLVLSVCILTACGVLGDNSIHVSNLSQLQNALKKGGTIVLDKNIEDVDSVLTVSKNVTLDLNNKTISSGEDLIYSDDIWSLFVVRGGTLTVTGNGTIDAKYLFTFSVQSKYEMDSPSTTQQANANVESSKLIIKNGTFKSGDKDDEATVVYLIGQGSTCEIRGGDFSVSTSDKSWVLNTEDNSENAAGKSLFKITGGTFHDFNPAETYPTSGHDLHNRVAEGYKVEKIGQTNDYKVVAEDK